MVKTKNHDLQTQEKIFKAATEIFEEKGFAAARMQEIADRAGINKALLHYYFRSKEMLFASSVPGTAEKDVRENPVSLHDGHLVREKD